ncbi:ComEA family DNA-binding protein [Balneola sp. MJW-20]|uniref:ComEA family DNA-binding protein n=1 Tax=Gracilimonas aurantiaca TaxID=3234185 RepID=UPI0034672C2D
MKWQNIRRSIFFKAEKLQITHNERIAVVFLLFSAIILKVSLNYIERKPLYSEEDYAHIQESIHRRIELWEQEEAEKLLRYEPDTARIRKDVKNTGELMEPVSVNMAGLKELTRLPGIGPSYAQRIIDYRNEHGGFKSLDELIRIKGIGKKRLESIRPYIKL